MRNWITLVEAITAPVLYHGTSLSNAIRILHDNKIGEQNYPVSLTRSRDIAQRFARTRVEIMWEDLGIFPEFTDEMADEGPQGEDFAAAFPLEYHEMEIFKYETLCGAILVLNHDALRHRHSVQPYDDRGRMERDDRWEFEERVKGSISPALPVIDSIVVRSDNFHHYIDQIMADPAAAKYHSAIQSLVGLITNDFRRS